MSELADLTTNVAVLISEVKSWKMTNEKDLTQITKSLEAHTKQLERVDLAIRGNGRRGLKARMESVEEFLRGIKKLTWILIGAAAVAVLGAVVAVLVNLPVTHKEQYREETQTKHVTAVDGGRAVPADRSDGRLP